MRKLILPLITCSLIIVGIFGCDTADQNFDFHQGNSLSITGPVSITIPQDTTTSDTTDVTSVQGTYYSEYATIDKDYTWSVTGDNSDGARKDSTFRDGQHLAVTFTAPGTYTISVDDGEYQGSVEVTATRQLNADL